MHVYMRVCVFVCVCVCVCVYVLWPLTSNVVKCVLIITIERYLKSERRSLFECMRVCACVCVCVVASHVQFCQMCISNHI
mmetsp:Transcript_53364/g.86425  ORF Transcript_53364/g.86425 Transcript_53364/m.86425 type:complete len:80 (-) Transcript_53364:90-329(-)